jgi:hypothetical protein
MIRPIVCCLSRFSSFALGAPASEWPAEWDLMSGNLNAYTLTVDHSVFSSGASSVLLASKRSSASGYGNLLQATDAAGYRGQRVRYSGDLKTQDVKNWAGLWFMVLDGQGKTLAFDNMQEKERRVRGNTDWQRHDIVLDVPAGGASIRYGVVLSGAGKVWADGLRIELVDQSIPVTSRHSAPSANMPLPHKPPPAPRNLDFEQ